MPGVTSPSTHTGVWSGDVARLDRVLPALRLARSRSHAAALLTEGLVRVNGLPQTKAGWRVAAGAHIQVQHGNHYVSRAAAKLIAGLNAFPVSVDGVLALDVGASTGGFTQVLLERGARQVIALDVGHGQLADTLRNDERVRQVEGCNARDLTPTRLAELTRTTEPPGLIVCDISFISLRLVLPQLVGIAAPEAELLLLIKPQFEVGRPHIRNGIVTDTAPAAQAVAEVILDAVRLGLEYGGISETIGGEHGNQEILAHFTRGQAVSQRSGDHPQAEALAEHAAALLNGQQHRHTASMNAALTSNRGSAQATEETSVRARHA